MRAGSGRGMPLLALVWVLYLLVEMSGFDYEKMLRFNCGFDACNYYFLSELIILDLEFVRWYMENNYHFIVNSELKFIIIDFSTKLQIDKKK